MLQGKLKNRKYYSDGNLISTSTHNIYRLCTRGRPQERKKTRSVSVVQAKILNVHCTSSQVK